MHKKKYFKIEKLIISITILLMLTMVLLQNLKAEDIKVNTIKFVVSAPAGGGWDRKVQALGKIIKKLGLVKNIKYKYLFYESAYKEKRLFQFRGVYDLIEKANQYKDVMLIFNNQLIAQYLQGSSKYSFKDLTPIASFMYTYRVFAVRPNSPYDTWKKFLKAYKIGIKNHKLMPKIGGLGNAGGMSSLIFTKALNASNENIDFIDYYGYKGSQLQKALDDKKVDLIVPTIHKKIIQDHKDGKIKIIGVASEKNLYIGELKEPLPSLKESYNINFSFKGWFGLFSPPNLNPKLANAYAKIIKKALDSKEWKKIAKKNGWTTFFKPREKFMDFLQKNSNSFKNIIKKMKSI